MKVLHRIILVHVVFVFFLSVSSSFAADRKEYPATPPAKVFKKWRVGYLQGGPWKGYRKSLIGIVHGLAELGWIEKAAIPPEEDEHDTAKLWSWLTANVKSKYLMFVTDAYYSADWKDEELRGPIKKRLLRRLNEDRDIDLMFAMGTWAGQDLANNDHSVPTIVGEATDAIAAGIVKSAEDSGYDHIHANVDPILYERQIRAFHDVLGFKKLGVPFQNTAEGRSYAAIEKIEKIAKERQFEIIPCHTTDVISKSAELEMIRCARELALKTDAYYAPAYPAINPTSLPAILAALNEHKVPVFSQDASFVRYGLLLSIASPDADGYGRFHAEVIGKIINGAKPRDLNQVYEIPVRFAFNAATAMSMGLDPEIFDFLFNTADVVYEKIDK
ncbi:MAG: ABC transporter substrate-binding protein [Desulfobacterales bacterium]|nr:ABC transporter substrate-binding protein [Desulfobacterales bacterium]